ncbi:CYTH and CHAD domain-containing protein [soil metagenome]
MARTDEIELKFEFGEDGELPSFEGLDGVVAVSEPVVHELRATYYDTADGRLAAGGLALRRRRGGDDEGWHLKESVDANHRLETHAPLGAGRRGVPAELAALVRSRTRRRKLVPVATVESRRIVRRLLDADASVLAEVADDHVTGAALGRPDTDPSSWREVEIELVDGGSDLLDAAAQRLAEAGAAPAAWGSKLARAMGDTGLDQRTEDPEVTASSTAGEVVTAHLREQVHALVALDPLVRQDEHDAVHKMRVATRRLRSALATFRRLLDRQVTEPIRDELKWMGGVLGAARDAEVIHARLCELLAAEPHDLVQGPVGARIDATMRERYAAAHARVLKAFDSARYLRLLDQLDDVASGAVVTGDRAARRSAKQLPKEVRRAQRRWQRQVDALAGLTGSARDLQLHEVRKSAKRLRYAADSVAPAIGGRAERLADRMEQLQEVLGQHQDGVVTTEVIAGLAAEATAAGEESFTYGRLHAVEQRAGEAGGIEAATLIDDLADRRPAWLR